MVVFHFLDILEPDFDVLKKCASGTRCSSLFGLPGVKSKKVQKYNSNKYTIHHFWDIQPLGRPASSLRITIPGSKSMDLNFKAIGEELWACWPAERLLTVSGPFLDI